MDLSKAKKATRTVKGQVDGEPFTVVYKPNVLTTAEWYRLQANASSKNPDDDFNTQYLLIVGESWDLTYDGKKPVPLTKEGLVDVGMMIMNEILKAILKDLLPNETTATTSGSFS